MDEPYPRPRPLGKRSVANVPSHGFAPGMNIHHLELFYYVARHGGIMEAVRNMPYGIQQPAMSGQILQLEAELGVKLFQRRPFELTPHGQELYAFVRPFFGSVDQVGERLRGGVAQTLRLAAPVMALRDHLPAVLQDLRKRFPKLKLTLRAGQQPQVWSWLERHELDLAITLLEEKSPPGLHQVPLLDLPVVFLVPAKSKYRSADDILAAVAGGNPTEPLITLTPGELAPRRLRELLGERGLDWPPDIEVTDLELIDVYVRRGFGIGLTLDVPGKSFPKEVRKVVIPQIAPLRLGAAWHGTPTAIMKELLTALRGQVAAIA
jgi:DNA-binding transcriptional LysR family regulator